MGESWTIKKDKILNRNELKRDGCISEIKICNYIVVKRERSSKGEIDTRVLQEREMYILTRGTKFLAYFLGTKYFNQIMN